MLSHVILQAIPVELGSKVQVREYLGKYNSSVKYKMTDDSSWMNDLKQKGLYYEGIVADSDSLLENHNRATVTTWGTRRSSTNTSMNMKEDMLDNANAVSYYILNHSMQIKVHTI